MSDVICQVCNRLNDPTAERCWYCQALLPTPPVSLAGNENSPDQEKPETIQAGKQAGEVAPTPNENPEEEIPAWLAHIRMLKKAEQESAGVQVQPEQFEGDPANTVPDWLPESESESTEKPAKEGELTNLAGEDQSRRDIEDNLKEIGILKDSQPGEESTPSELEGEEIPDLEQSDQVPPETSLSDEEAFLESFLAAEAGSSAGGGGYEGESTETVMIEENPPPLHEENGHPPEINPEDLRPDEFGWNPDEAEILEEESGNSEDEFFIPVPYGAEDLPDWLDADSPSTHLVEETEHDVPATKPGEEGAAEEGVDINLEATNEPPAAEEVQSLQEVTTTGIEEEVTSISELTGIAVGVLPELTLAKEQILPAVVASPLQQKNATLFHALLTDSIEKQHENELPKGKSLSRFLLKIVVAVLIIGAACSPFLLSSSPVVTPILFPAEVISTFSNIRNLPVEKPVLIAAHFEAALAGEMKAAYRPVLAHLLSRDIGMALISTNVIGSAILEDEILKASRGYSAFNAEQKFINLGYLAGGSLGTASLSRELRQQLPFTTELQPAWEYPLLSGIESIKDFGGVILITDNPEVARTWVEQVKPALGATPLLVLVSAQAAPLVQPYYGSGQVDGYVSGVNGSLSYNQILSESSEAGLAFSSFQVTLLVILLIMFVGGVVSLIMNAVTPANQRGKR